MAALEAQLLTHVEMITALVDGMAERGFGRIVNITSASVKAPIQNLGLSTASRLALHGFSSTVCREVMSRNVTINSLLPGPFETDRLTGNMRHAATQSGKSYDEIYESRRKANPAGRFGTAEEFGAACAFLCSVHAGFITGQSLLMDGGAYTGNF
jgi:3-oxoacyl-[acyl-carrier protein] reductase